MVAHAGKSLKLDYYSFYSPVALSLRDGNGSPFPTDQSEGKANRNLKEHPLGESCSIQYR